MKVLPVALTALAALSLSFGPASARKCVGRAPLSLQPGWTAEFRSEFEHADAVYLVRAANTGPPLGMAMPCDYPRAPPPPTSGMTQRREARDAHRKAERAAQTLNRSCDPASAVNFTVIEVIKGPARRAWVERTALFDVRPGPPPEPFAAGPAFARHVAAATDFECGVSARRLSRDATYLVFGRTSPEASAQDPLGLAVSRVYLADAPTPFLAQARALRRDRK